MKHVDWIDTAKGIGILLVVVGHAPINTKITRIIFAFHMPFFFFISGYLFNYQKYKGHIKQFTFNKTKRLIIPYFFTNLFILSTLVLISCIRTTSINFELFSIENFIGIIYGNGAPLFPATTYTNWICVPSWFLVCLFCSNILLYFILTVYENKSTFLSYSLILFFILTGWKISEYIFLPWGIDIAFVSMIFVCSGYFVRTNNIIDIREDNFNAYIFAFICILFIIIVSGSGRVDMNLRKYPNFFLFIMGGLLGTYITVELAKMINKNKTIISNFFNYLGKYSIIILLYHLFATKTFLVFMESFISFPDIIYNGYLYATIMLIISILTVILINKISIFKKVYG
ncbi:acyltransferase family protein [Methanolobus sp. WCC4]|uniref:acyltransferase family protein n=1 Tax=Methanolobus sp. WCC4 TaxID=3125784 RepID=UPI0030F66025